LRTAQYFTVVRVVADSFDLVIVKALARQSIMLAVAENAYFGGELYPTPKKPC
jgi:hypothetical protein